MRVVYKTAAERQGDLPVFPPVIRADLEALQTSDLRTARICDAEVQGWKREVTPGILSDTMGAFNRLVIQNWVVKSLGR